MRLLNTKTLKLEDFSSKILPPYAILSHTWEESGEIDYEQWTSLRKRLGRKFRNNKVTQLCQLAREHNLRYAWIDTCCINKKSSSELDESINSMFEWYRAASVCFVYLADLSEHATLETGLSGCRWITRGWTLQELIAPSNVKFFDKTWAYRGTKIEHQTIISSCTGIPAAILSGHQSLESCSINTRMQWTLKRRTTRPEDRAYCLLGIFDVNMTHIYGEGDKAFLRLQERIQHRHQIMSALTHVNGSKHAQSSTNSLLATTKVHSLCVPLELMSSYQNSDLYPANLINKRHILEHTAREDRLYDDISKICVDKESSTDITFQDFNVDDQENLFERINTESNLLHYLGDQSRLSPPGRFITKEDPQTRLIFLSTTGRYRRLKATKDMLFRILSYHQVPVLYLQSLHSLNQHQSLYAQNSSSVPQRSFWTQQTFGNSGVELEAPDLNRSGRYYEMVFGFQGVEYSSESNQKHIDQWSVSNAAFYHKLDVVHGTALWILTKQEWISESLVREACSMTRGNRSHNIGTIEGSFVSGLTIHILLASWVSDSWWSYLQFLENQFHTEICPAYELDDHRTLYTTDDFRHIQAFQRRITEAMGTLQSNQRTLGALTTFYRNLCAHPQFPQAEYITHALEDFLNRIKNLEERSTDLEARALHLSKISEALGQLVLEIMHTQTSDHLHNLSSQSTTGLASLKLFSAVTVIFLPASFVTSFYSMNTFSMDMYQPLTSNHTILMVLICVVTGSLVIAFIWSSVHGKGTKPVRTTRPMPVEDGMMLKRGRTNRKYDLDQFLPRNMLTQAKSPYI